MTDTDKTSLGLELRRGAIVLGSLSRLQEEHYGYSLREELAAMGLEVKEGTLYPLLRRLESQGLLQSRWEVGEGRPRRYYRISPRGKRVLEAMTVEWNALVGAMTRVLEDRGTS